MEIETKRLVHLKALLEEAPEDEFVHYAIAQEYLKHEAFELAIQWFCVLKDINAKYIGLYYHLGHCLSEIGDPAAAIQIYDEGITIARELSDQHALSELLNSRTNLLLEL